MSFNVQQGLIFIISSPSGGGKSSLTRALLKLNPQLQLSISTTTRPPRPGEVDGTHYYFKTKAEFQQLIDQDLLLEHAKIYDYYYGTLKQPIATALTSGIDILFDIDWQGTNAIKQLLPKNTVSIFILPPSIDILKQRLQQRAQDAAEIIERRLQAAIEEIKFAKYYDYVITNDHFETALQALHAIFITEKIKQSRVIQLESFDII
jgi:guanylate kinase